MRFTVTLDLECSRHTSSQTNSHRQNTQQAYVPNPMTFYRVGAFILMTQDCTLFMIVHIWAFRRPLPRLLPLLYLYLYPTPRDRPLLKTLQHHSVRSCPSITTLQPWWPPQNNNNNISLPLKSWLIQCHEFSLKLRQGIETEGFLLSQFRYLGVNLSSTYHYTTNRPTILECNHSLPFPSNPN